MSALAHIIVNPVAGRRRSDFNLEKLTRILKSGGIPVHAHITAGPGDARSYAAGLDPDLCRMVVVCGGDGLINEVINGLPDLNIPLGIVPTGTANMLAKELHIPLPFDPAARLLLKSSIRRIDLGRAGDRLFCAFAGIGITAEITRRVHLRRKGHISYFNYVAPLVQTLFTYPFPSLRIHIDGRELPLAVSTVVVSNIRRYGAVFNLDPDAAPDSGDLHITTLRNPTPGAHAGYGLAVLLRYHRFLSGIRRHTGRRIRIESAEPVPVELDGDYCMNTPVEIHLLPDCLPVIAPPLLAPGSITLLKRLSCFPCKNRLV